MNVLYFLFLGLILALCIGFRPHRLLQIALSIYWFIIFTWSLEIIHPFTFQPIAWSKVLQIYFSWHIDGLARLFSLLISGIGVLIFIYAAIYFQGERIKQAKLLGLLQIFAIGMLIIVITDNTIVLFLGWEITTITSYLLIQFDVANKEANRAAFNSMFLTVLGALPMLAGILLLHSSSYSWSIQLIIHNLQDSPILIVTFYLLIFGVITKSAQFPFYFWLPGAMKAPTPVSAYLHSATMVNAGIYLLARFHPLFNSLNCWYPTLVFFGISTMVISSILSLFQRDLKAILAYTTLFALGVMVNLLASNQWLSIQAFTLFLLFHSLYKAAAFMWVGTTDKSYGSRDLFELQGLGRQWPGASIIAIISLSAMAGLPPFFGFVVKEMLYEAKLAAGSISYGLMALSTLSSMLIAATSFKCLYYWFIGKPSVNIRKNIRYGSLCAFILSVIILGLEILEPYLLTFLKNATNSIISEPIEANVISVYWGPILSLITVIGGIVLFLIYNLFKHSTIDWPRYLNPLFLFEETISKLLQFGRWFTSITQYQALSRQLVIILTAFVLWLYLPLYRLLPSATKIHWASTPISINVLSFILLLVGGSLLMTHHFLKNMISISMIGLVISAIFVLQGAADVAMTQLLIEILTVIIIVIALRKANLPTNILNKRQKLTHACIAILTGSIITVLLFIINMNEFNPYISKYYIQNSFLLAYGRNIVNVILVDFRAFDTLGEVLVIFSSAIAIWLLISHKLPTSTKNEGAN